MSRRRSAGAPRTVASAAPRAEAAPAASASAAGVPAALAGATVVILGAAYGLHRLIDPDLFQQIAVGRALLAHPGSIGVSTFIRAWPDYPYVEDKWLGCVVVALFDRVGGADGVMVYQIALCVAVAAAWFVMLRRWEVSREIAVLGVAAALFMCAFRLEPRPDTASHALLAATIALVTLRKPFRVLAGVTAALFVLWINVHGYFVNGLLVLIATAVAAALGDRTLRGDGMPTPRQRLGLLGVALAACLVHPQGWRALASPVQQLLLMRSAALHGGIQELEPVANVLRGASAVQWVLLVASAVAALVVALAGASTARRQAVAAGAALVWLVWPPAAMADALPYRLTSALWIMAVVEVGPAIGARRFFAPLLLVGFTVLTVPAVRNLPLLAPAALLLLAPAWTSLQRRLPARGRSRVVAGAALAAVVVAVAWIRLSDRLNGDVRAPLRTGWGVDGDRFPVAATDFVLRNGLADALLNGFDDGGYLLYRMHPERRVFIAGNTSMYPVAFFEEYRERVTGRGLDLDAFTTRDGIDTVVWNLASAATPHLFATLAADPRWKLAFLDYGGVVFTRSPQTPALDLASTVAALGERHVWEPALPTWLGGKRLEYPALDVAAFLYTIGHPELALVAAERLWQAVQTERIALLIGTTASQTGTLGTRLPLLESALARWPESADLQQTVFLALATEAGRLLSSGDLATARTHLTRMRTLQPNACGPYTGLAKIAALEGNTAEARALIAQALSRDTDGSCRQGLQADPQLSTLMK